MKAPKRFYQGEVRLFGRSREGAFEVRGCPLGPSLSCWIIDTRILAQFYNTETHAHFDFDAKNTLPEQNVSYSIINKIASRLARMNHKSIGKFHGLGTCSTKLARNDDL